MKIRELSAHPQEEITGFFLVHQKDLRSNRTGETYLSLTLGDDSGSVDARVWDGLDTLPAFVAGDVIKVKGRVQVHRNRVQLSVMQLRATENGEVSPGDFLPKSERDSGPMWSELRQIVASFTNAHLRALVNSVLEDATVAERFQRAPAAKSMHHAFRGGLLEHVLSVCRMCDQAAIHYRELFPTLRRDLLLTGAILHDIGKIYELSYDTAFLYTTEGQLVGHLVQGASMIREKMRAVPGFPDEYRLLVEHMILSHHGQLEFGSPKEPQFPEALLLHYLDDLDSKMEAMRTIIAATPDQEWSARCPALERSLLNLDRFLQRVEGSAEAGNAKGAS